MQVKYISNPLASLLHRVKVFKGKKVHGEFDIKVEQVGCSCTFVFFIVSFPCIIILVTGFPIQAIKDLLFSLTFL